MHAKIEGLFRVFSELVHERSQRNKFAYTNSVSVEEQILLCENMEGLTSQCDWRT